MHPALFQPEECLLQYQRTGQEFRYLDPGVCTRTALPVSWNSIFRRKQDSLMALELLQFWRDFYHVDGFHVLGEGFNREMLLRDGILSGAKLDLPGL